MTAKDYKKNLNLKEEIRSLKEKMCRADALQKDVVQRLSREVERMHEEKGWSKTKRIVHTSWLRNDSVRMGKAIMQGNAYSSPGNPLRSARGE